MNTKSSKGQGAERPVSLGRTNDPAISRFTGDESIEVISELGALLVIESI